MSRRMLTFLLSLLLSRRATGLEILSPANDSAPWFIKNARVAPGGREQSECNAVYGHPGVLRLGERDQQG